MSSSKQKSKKRHIDVVSSDETIKLDGFEKPQIYTSKEPSKPDKLPDYMDDSQLSQETIRNIVSDIQKTPQNKEKRIEYFSMKYPEFYEKYPILFDMACRDVFDYEKFNYMMRIREQIAAKERTIEHASVEVGQKIFDMYMKK